MLKGIVDRYLELFPEDEPKLKLLLEQLENKEDLDDRKNFHGHICGDAIIFSPDYKKILMIYHVRYQRWNQPGGHWDKGEEGPWLASEREAYEETGLKNLKRLSLTDDYRVPFHIIDGFVEASQAKNEPDHWHHDFRYAYVASSEDLSPVDDEGVAGAKWFPLDEVKEMGNLKLTISRLTELASSHRLKA